jgi:hypothetical protein
MVPARSSVHDLSCSRRLSPVSGRNSTYRPVQICGAGSIGFNRQLWNGLRYLKMNASLPSYHRRKASVERSIGNGEVDSSILSGSTSRSHTKALKIQHNSRFPSIVGFDHFSHFEQNRPRRRVPTDTKLAHRFYFCLRPFRPGLRALSRPHPAPTGRPLLCHGAAPGTGADCH